jgi:hypothetical protein
VLVTVAAVAALVTGSVLGTADAERAQTAAIKDFPTFLFATIAEGHFRGSVAVVQRTSRPRADIFISLHGLDAGKTFRAEITAAACGGGGASPKALLSVTAGTTEAGEDDFFETTSGRLKARLARGKAVRILMGGKQIACARANRVR